MVVVVVVVEEEEEEENAAKGSTESNLKLLLQHYLSFDSLSLVLGRLKGV